MRRIQLTIQQILHWADAYRERTGKWPEKASGRVWEVVDEKWVNVDQALRKGLRGLRRGSSLARLLAKHRGKRNRKQLPRFTIRRIMKWADAHYRRHRKWPLAASGPIDGARGETWWSVDMALRNGLRGLPGGSSLAKLLSSKRDVPNRAARPRLTVGKILRWADEHKRRTGNWPTAKSGLTHGASGETWGSIDNALKHGHRGLRKGMSLFRLLKRHRGVTRHVRRTPLTVNMILAWADAHHARTDQWPKRTAGPVPEAPGVTWLRIDTALAQGKRGLRGGTSLARLLADRRNVRNRAALRKLSERQILDWTKAYRGGHGVWPTRHSGLIAGTNGETWYRVDSALKRGGRGLSRRSSLTQLVGRT